MVLSKKWFLALAVLPCALAFAEAPQEESAQDVWLLVKNYSTVNVLIRKTSQSGKPLTLSPGQEYLMRSRAGETLSPVFAAGNQGDYGWCVPVPVTSSTRVLFTRNNFGEPTPRCESQALPEQLEGTELETLRKKVVQQYVTDLGKTDYEDIISLFVPGGMVTSTSRGKVDARAFFAGFFPEIGTAKTAMHGTFHGMEDKNRLAAKFHFDYLLKDGEAGAGEYVDEFIFPEKSYRLSLVNMFENLKME